MSPVLMCLITIVFLQISLFCTTMYLHRSLTHGSVKFHPTLAFGMHLWIWLLTGIKPKEWVAVHRKHHRFSDEEGDPHSPYLYGLPRVFFFNAYYYHREASDPVMVKKFAPDYKGTAIDSIPHQGKIGLVFGILIFCALFGWVWGAGLFFAHAILYILLNASINSFCHVVGYRNYVNKATNNRGLALAVAGEGLHNNHHKYPTAWHFACRPGELDPAGGVIGFFRRIGLAETQKLPQSEEAA